MTEAKTPRRTTHYKFEREVINELNGLNKIFDKVFSFGGGAIFTDKIETSAIAFSKNEGNPLGFYFNEDFYRSLTVREKAFVICHEMLHVLLNHGLRFKQVLGDDEESRKNEMACNIAADIVVNEICFRYFGFSERDLPNIYDKCVTCDRVFHGREPKDESFEYYYERIRVDDQLMKKVCGDGNSPLDNHDLIASDSGSGSGKELLDQITDQLSEEDKRELKNLQDKHKESLQQKAGTEPGGTRLEIHTGRVRKKKKWSTLIDKVRERRYAYTPSFRDTFIRPRRRYASIIQRNRDITLPTSSPSKKTYKITKRAQVWLFLDCSGSCEHLRNDFFAAARSIPTKEFDVKAHAFDTRVEEIDINTNEISMWGGTSFTCIENYVLEHARKRYPDYVFVITDGHGNQVAPRFPENWTWLIDTEDNLYRTNSLWPTKCREYLLSEFDFKK